MLGFLLQDFGRVCAALFGQLFLHVAVQCRFTSLLLLRRFCPFSGLGRSRTSQAEDLRQGGEESPRTGTKRNRDPDDHENRDGMLIGYTFDEEAGLEKEDTTWHLRNRETLTMPPLSWSLGVFRQSITGHHQLLRLTRSIIVVRG